MFSSWADNFKESRNPWNFHWQPTFLATTLASTVSLHHLQTKTSLQMGEQSYLQSIVFQQVKFIIIG